MCSVEKSFASTGRNRIGECARNQVKTPVQKMKVEVYIAHPRPKPLALSPPRENLRSDHTTCALSTYNLSKMKRKTEERGSLDANGLPESKKRALSSEEAVARFRDGLFDAAEEQQYTEAYAKSTPYVWCASTEVITSQLINTRC